MGKTRKQSTRLEQKLPAHTVADALEQLAAGIRGGEVTLGGDRPITMRMADAMQVKLEAKARDKKASISLKLAWKPSAAPEMTGDGATKQQAPAEQATSKTTAAEEKPAKKKAAKKKAAKKKAAKKKKPARKRAAAAKPKSGRKRSTPPRTGGE
ncbi:MAG: amphi-Trp domain-containing protein [Myxococcales bacterium]|jgi:histone H1/5